MSEVVYLIRYVLDTPVNQRNERAKAVLAMQTWVQAGGWQLMSAGSGWRFEVVIETSTGPKDAAKLRAPIYITSQTDLQCIYWRPRRTYRMPAAGEIV